MPFSLPSPSSLLRFRIVVMQKWCYHGSVTSHSFFTQMAGSFARFVFKHLLDILKINLRELVEINIFYVMFSVKKLQGVICYSILSLFSHKVVYVVQFSTKRLQGLVCLRNKDSVITLSNLRFLHSWIKGFIEELRSVIVIDQGNTTLAYKPDGFVTLRIAVGMNSSEKVARVILVSVRTFFSLITNRWTSSELKSLITEWL